MNCGSNPYKFWAVTDTPVLALGVVLGLGQRNSGVSFLTGPEQQHQPPLPSSLFSLNPSSEILGDQDHSSQRSACACATVGVLYPQHCIWYTQGSVVAPFYRFRDKGKFF